MTTIFDNLNERLSQQKQRRPQSNSGRFDIAKYLEDHSIEVVTVKQRPDGATMHGLRACLFDENHSPNEAAIIQAADGKLLYQCFHESCKSRTWTDARKQISGEEKLGSYSGGETEKEKQADALIRIGKAAELFMSIDGTPWARFECSGHFEAWPLRSRGSGFRRKLIAEFYKETGTAPSATAVQSAIDVLEAEAQFGQNRSTREVFTRVAGHEGAIYLDLADDRWRVAKVTSEGWEIINAAPVCFRRTRGMLQLPEPKRGGNLRTLARLVNLGDEENQRLILSWLTYTLNPAGPYPLLCLVSEQGSGKSTTAKVLRLIVDPNQAPTRALPKCIEDLAVAASHSWIVSFDNLSFLPDTFSDALCRLSTGGGFACRALYTNDEEAVFWHKRPAILNGISEFTGRPDLLERSLIVRLPAIPPGLRRPEGEVLAEFDRMHPELLGAVLDAAVLALRNRPGIRLTECSRMADFAYWTAAAAPAIEAEVADMVGLLLEKQAEAVLSELDAPLPQAVMELLDARAGKFEGLMSELLAKLTEVTPEETTRQKSWPQTPRGLRNALARMVPVLRIVGVKFQELGRTKRGRQILLEGDGTRSRVTVQGPKVTVGDGTVTEHRHHLNAQKQGKGDGTRPKGDGSDGHFPSISFHSRVEREWDKGEVGQKEKRGKRPSPPSPLNLLGGEL